MHSKALSPAERAANEALNEIIECVEQRKSFLVEAGAGAGKTHSLIGTLRHIIDTQGRGLLHRSQQVACITYTNVATEEIRQRTDRHAAIYSSTIHSFYWLLIKDFQPWLRKELAQCHEWWEEKLQELGGIGLRTIGYDEFGRRTIDERSASLHHNDVLTLSERVWKLAVEPCQTS